MNAIIDAVADDLLGKIRLKPWWESWRAYAYKASIAVIVLFSIYQKSKFHCMPKHADASDYSRSQSVAVDAFCGDQSIPWYIYRGDLIAFGTSIITYILSNSWIHISGVYDKLTDLSTFGRSSLEVNMSADEMENAAVLPITSSSNDNHRLLRRNVLILLKYRSHSAISKFYFIRCVLVFIWTGICTAAALWLSVAELSHPITVICEVTDEILLLGLGNLSNSFVCVDKATAPTAMLETIFAITLLLQFLSMIVALQRQRQQSPPRKKVIITWCGRYSRCPISCSTYQPLTKLSDTRTFLILMMGLDKQQAKKIELFTEFILSIEDFPVKLQENAGEAIIAGDVEYFTILKKKLTTEKFLNCVENAATAVLCNGDRKVAGKDEETADADYQVYTFLVQTNLLALKQRSLNRVSYTKNRKNDETLEHIRHGEEFRQNLIKHYNLHLLFCCPMNFILPAFYLGSIKSDMLDDKGRSFLFYVLRKSSMDKLLSRSDLFEMLLNPSEENTKLVHFEGKSMNPEDFFYENYAENYGGKPPNFRLFESSQPIQLLNECEPEVRRIYGVYYEVTHGENDDCIEELTSMELSKLKLTRVDDPLVYAFAKEAANNRHWEVLVTLINTYIVLHEQGKRPDEHNLMGNDIFNLRQSQYLNEIFKETLKRPRCQPYFVPTAAEHILSIVDAETRQKMLSHIQRAAIPSDAKERLEKISQIPKAALRDKQAYKTRKLSY